MTTPTALLEADNPFDYPSPIWQRFTRPLLAGRFAADEPGVISGRAGTPAASSVLELQLKWEDGRVRDARFRAYGCPASIAVGGWLADWSIGRSAPELAGITAAELRRALEIPDEKAHCALLGEDVVKALLKETPRNLS
jgi:NifU-like protein involved in Fe-S cluster formation